MSDFMTRLYINGSKFLFVFLGKRHIHMDLKFSLGGENLFRVY